MHDALLAIHSAAGALALLAGPIAFPLLFRADARSRRLTAYELAIAGVTASAVLLAAFDWSVLWPLAIVAVAVEAAALAGWRLAARPSAADLTWRLRFLCGTYVGLVTALLVVSWDSPLAWFVPTLLAAPLIERATTAAGRTREPAGRTREPVAAPAR